MVFEEGVGPVPVTVRAAGGEPAFARLSVARLPEFGPPPPAAAEIARVLSLDVADLADGGAEIRAASCGMPFLFVPVRDRAALARARVNRVAWEGVLAGYWAPDVSVLALDPERPGSDLRARVFAPRLGIEEDPATGAAAAALGGYLGARAARDGTLRWVVEQGFEMGRPSIIEVEADREGGAITAVRVGGASVMVGEGRIEVPDA
jgi:trans-2,3-dihydro-3-hydroxyanthranilate isomerase